MELLRNSLRFSEKSQQNHKKAPSLRFGRDLNMHLIFQMNQNTKMIRSTVNMIKNLNPFRLLYNQIVGIKMIFLMVDTVYWRVLYKKAVLKKFP